MGTAQTSGDRVGEVLVRAPREGPATWAWDPYSSALRQQPRQTALLVSRW